MNKALSILFSSLLFCNIAQAESSLPECQGSNFPTWTNCYGKVGPLPISDDIYAGEWKGGKYHGQGIIEHPDGTKYIGKWKDGLPHGKGTLTESGGNMLGNGKMARDMDRELTQCQMDQNMLDNGKIVYQMEKAPIHLLMDCLLYTSPSPRD